MTGTLLLRLSGPMQSWGVESRFDVRDTGYEPSKSGVIGLLCAALGRPRWGPLTDLASLRMGVRVDQEGRLEKDFHTAGKDGYYRVSGGVERSKLIVSNRYYLADACFLVGLEGDVALLRELDGALYHPVWPLYLGRKAFVPGEPVRLPDGLQEGVSLLEVLEGYPWLAEGRHAARNKRPERLRIVYDDPDGAVVRPDLPVSFVQGQRAFRPRRVTVDYIPTPPVGEQEGA